MKEEKKVLFTINGFEVRSNSLYSVSDKPDGDAPSGFVAANVSKLPHDGVDEIFGPRWVSRGGKKGVWDTGFYEYSPCYDGLEDNEKKIIVKALTEKVLKPYRVAIGDPKAFDLDNQEFLDSVLFNVHSNTVYNTDDPISLMSLYFALRTYQVAPRGQEGDPKYRDCFYILNDTSKKVREDDERIMMAHDASRIFHKLYENDREKLFTVLEWLGFKLGKDPDERTLVRMFTEYNTGSFQRSKAFVDTVKESETEVALNKFNLYKKLKEVIGSTNRISKSPKGVYFIDGDIELGPDLKAAAENIAKNKDLNRIKKELLLLEESEL